MRTVQPQRVKKTTERRVRKMAIHAKKVLFLLTFALGFMLVFQVAATPNPVDIGVQKSLSLYEQAQTPAEREELLRGLMEYAWDNNPSTAKDARVALKGLGIVPDFEERAKELNLARDELVRKAKQLKSQILIDTKELEQNKELSRYRKRNLEGSIKKDEKELELIFSALSNLGDAAEVLDGTRKAWEWAPGTTEEYSDSANDVTRTVQQILDDSLQDIVDETTSGLPLEGAAGEVMAAIKELNDGFGLLKKLGKRLEELGGLAKSTEPSVANKIMSKEMRDDEEAIREEDRAAALEIKGLLRDVGDSIVTVAQIKSTHPDEAWILDFVRQEDQIQSLLLAGRGNANEAARLKMKLAELTQTARSSAQVFDRESFLNYEQEMQDLADTIRDLEGVSSELWQKAYDLAGEAGTHRAHEMLGELLNSKMSVKRSVEEASAYSAAVARWHEANFPDATPETTPSPSTARVPVKVTEWPVTMIKEERAGIYHVAMLEGHLNRDSGNTEEALARYEIAKDVYDSMGSVERINARRDWSPPQTYIKELKTELTSSKGAPRQEPDGRSTTMEIPTIPPNLGSLGNKDPHKEYINAMIREEQKSLSEARTPSEKRFAQNRILTLESIRDIVDIADMTYSEAVEAAKNTLKKGSAGERLTALNALGMLHTIDSRPEIVAARQATDLNSIVSLLEDVGKNDIDPFVRNMAKHKARFVTIYHDLKTKERTQGARSYAKGTVSSTPQTTYPEQETPERYLDLARSFQRAGQFQKAADMQRRYQESFRQRFYEKASKASGLVTSARPKETIGGVELNYAKKLSTSEALRGAEVDVDTATITFIGNSGERYMIEEVVRKEIMDALLYLHRESGNISNLAFTLDITQEEMARSHKEEQAWLKENIHTVRQKGQGTYKITAVRVQNIPRYLGLDYGDTIIGKTVLDADLALKYLTNGLHPVTQNPFSISEEYRRALERAGPATFRVWLYLKSARIDEDAGRINVDVKVGVKTKTIKYITNQETVDIGEGSKQLQTVVRILEENYDIIAKEVPSWSMLKEVYKGIAIIQLLEGMASIPEVKVSALEVRTYDNPKYVDGLALYHLRSNGLSTVTGGVNLSLRNEYNIKQTDSNNYWRKFFQMSLDNSSDPYWRATGSFLRWDLDGVISRCSENVTVDPTDWRSLNLRGNAYFSKALKLAKPKGFYNPSFLSEILDEKILQEIERNGINIDASYLGKALLDYETAVQIDALVPYMNLAVLNQIREIPGGQWEKKALATEDEAEKIRLHRKAADLYLETGNYLKAAKRLEYLSYQLPDDFEAHLRLVNAYVEDAKTRLPVDDDFPRVLFLPLRNSTENPKDAWLSKGIGHLLDYAAKTHGGIELVDHSKVEEAKETFGYSDQDLYTQGFAPNTISNLYEISASHIVAGSYMKLGSMVKLTLELLDKGRDTITTVEVKGNLKESHDLVKKVYDQILFEVTGRVASDAPYDGLPVLVENLKIWCEARDAVARGDIVEADSYLSEKLKEANGEAALIYAEISIQQGNPKEAVAILDKVQVSDQLMWRREYLLGLAKYAIGEMESAREHLGRASQMNRRSELPLVVLREIQPVAQDKYLVDKKLMDMRTSFALPYLESALFLLESGARLEALKRLRSLFKNRRELDREALEAAEEIWSQISKWGGVS